MYIEPQSDIFLMKGINWNNNYEDTMYFSDLSSQYSFFANQVKNSGNFIFTKQSYQRHSQGVLRILANAEMIMDCNYLMFQNKGHGGIPKWFYCFINNIEYVNENTTDVYYEIDEIQTWLWGLELGQSFIEREIPETDNLYENLVPENIETGEFTVQHEEYYDLMNPRLVPATDFDPEYVESDYNILVTALTDRNGNYATSESDWETYVKPHYITNGIPSGVMFFTYKIHLHNGVPVDTDLAAFLGAIQAYNDKGIIDNIVNVQAVPSLACENAKSYSSSTPYANREIGGYFLPDAFINGTTNTSYTPRNNKLYNYPYMRLLVSNNSGNTAEYHFEDFANSATDPIKFKFKGCVNGTPAITATPLDYKGMKEAFDYSVSLTNFPTIPLMNDTFKAYMAQNKASLNTQVLSNIVDSGFDFLSNAISYRGAVGSAISSVLGSGTNVDLMGNHTRGESSMNLQGVAINMSMRDKAGLGMIKSLTDIGFTIASAVATVEGHKAAPKTVANLTQNDALNLIIHRCGYAFYTIGIKPEMAKIIDDYFSMFGYAQHKVKIPNIKSRPYWNYTKTKGCILKGSCPSITKTNLSAIFDSGIRFWKNNNQIGDYSLPNLP